MRFDIITMFPEMFRSVFSGGIVKKAMDSDLIEVNIHDLRDYAFDKHRQVDDRPYGGSAGMVLKPEPIFSAVEKIRSQPSAPVFLLSPQGKKLNSRLAAEHSRLSQIILICGRYDGVDERIVQHLITDEISIGDYVLSGGEPAAVVFVDVVSRFVPQVVGKRESLERDSFYSDLLDYPQYTRPKEYKGMRVPEVLFSGDHEKIEKWRKLKMMEKTSKKRPDLFKKTKLSPEDT